MQSQHLIAAFILPSVKQSHPLHSFPQTSSPPQELRKINANEIHMCEKERKGKRSLSQIDLQMQEATKVQSLREP